MMTDVVAIWEGLTVPDDALSATLHPDSRGVWLAIDPSRRRHLLVRVPNQRPGQHLLTTHGLNASTERLAVDTGAPDIWVDIVCLDEAMDDTFATVADDLVAETRANPDDPYDAVQATLRRWKWFWGIDTSGMSDEKLIGLFGELWFMHRWASLPEVIHAWLGPTGGRHDFASPTVSVEVKASRVRADGPVRHRITSLDQLTAPETGDLYLFSLTVANYPNAANSLPGLVRQVRDSLRDTPDVLGLFDRRLADAGWSPAAAKKNVQTFRVTAEELYRVDGSFPRLTADSFPDGLPAGVDNVTYTVDLAACVDWRVATQPAEAADLLREMRP